MPRVVGPMPPVSAKVSARIAAGLKQFQPVLSAAKTRDINESDTGILVSDMLAAIFGYDKYGEITSEHAIRSTFCDLAVKLDGALEFLIEVKAIGLELKDNHVRQAVDYAANQGCDWVVLTNGLVWRVYRVTFTKPINHELVVEFNLCEVNARKTGDIETVALLAKEGWQKAHLGEYHIQRQALSRFSLAAMILSDSVIHVLRREVRRAAPGVKVDADEIRAALRSDVLKREVLEGDKAVSAQRHVSRAASRTLRARAEKPASGGDSTSQSAGEVST